MIFECSPQGSIPSFLPQLEHTGQSARSWNTTDTTPTQTRLPVGDADLLRWREAGRRRAGATAGECLTNELPKKHLGPRDVLPVSFWGIRRVADVSGWCHFLVANCEWLMFWNLVNESCFIITRLWTVSKSAWRTVWTFVPRTCLGTRRPHLYVYRLNLNLVCHWPLNLTS